MDTLLESCYNHCFICETKLPPPKLDFHGVITGETTMELRLEGEYVGQMLESVERICENCRMDDSILKILEEANEEATRRINHPSEARAQ